PLPLRLPQLRRTEPLLTQPGFPHRLRCDGTGEVVSGQLSVVGDQWWLSPPELALIRSRIDAISLGEQNFPGIRGGPSMRTYTRIIFGLNALYQIVMG